MKRTAKDQALLAIAGYLTTRNRRQAVAPPIVSLAR
jgi:hypothetical protein